MRRASLDVENQAVGPLFVLPVRSACSRNSHRSNTLAPLQTEWAVGCQPYLSRNAVCDNFVGTKRRLLKLFPLSAFFLMLFSYPASSWLLNYGLDSLWVYLDSLILSTWHDMAEWYAVSRELRTCKVCIIGDTGTFSHGNWIDPSTPAVTDSLGEFVLLLIGKLIWTDCVPWSLFTPCAQCEWGEPPRWIICLLSADTIPSAQSRQFIPFTHLCLELCESHAILAVFWRLSVCRLLGLLFPGSHENLQLIVWNQILLLL